ncbi:hypothetical protein LTR46_003958 [Exophiala xenobiotica]|nr:hypothetical protein LTR46_003958 [Exophiala xenobiotica]
MMEGRPEPRRRPGLPLHPEWRSDDEYVQSLLSFATSSNLFRNLCGGVHILDFLTREPDLYTHVLPQDWRDWFDLVTIDQVLDLLMHKDLSDLGDVDAVESPDLTLSPPPSLLDYIRTVRKHCLQRQFQPVSDDISDLPRHVSVGMKTKKVHEVTNFAAYIGNLSADVSGRFDEPISVVDFGSGQNYLGRTLASPPYNKHVIAVERRHHNIVGARGMDVHAKLAKKENIMRNKKEWKRQLATLQNNGNGNDNNLPTPPPEKVDTEHSSCLVVPDQASFAEADITYEEADPEDPDKGSMTYVEHDVQDGYLEDILYPPEDDADVDVDIDTTTTNGDCCASCHNHNHHHNDNIDESDEDHGNEDQRITDPKKKDQPKPKPKAMVVSLHSCGNLSHHGIRSLILNPSVCAVAMIGCCYNLLTERLGPATYKVPNLLRPNHPRLEATGSAYDPHGFPMSRTLEDFTTTPHTHTHTQEEKAKSETGQGQQPRGVKLNITARMMAVQAPYNWGPDDSEAFFRRHFYRTLLQRILLDLGVVQQHADPGSLAGGTGGSITGKDTSGTPLIVGSLPKACFTNFRAYVRGALDKLIHADPVDGPMIAERTRRLLVDDDMIDGYERKWGYAKKHLAVMWSLMAFSAGVVESIIVTDRWLYLKEQACVEDAWVDIVFDYKHSPRNFVVVGIKKNDEPAPSPVPAPVPQETS